MAKLIIYPASLELSKADVRCQRRTSALEKAMYRHSKFSIDFKVEFIAPSFSLIHSLKIGNKLKK